MVGKPEESGVMDVTSMTEDGQRQLKAVIDQQLHELRFPDLCKRIAQKVVERVQKIDEEHDEIKRMYNDIGSRLDILLADQGDDLEGTNIQLSPPPLTSPMAWQQQSSSLLSQEQLRQSPKQHGNSNELPQQIESEPERQCEAHSPKNVEKRLPLQNNVIIIDDDDESPCTSEAVTMSTASAVSPVEVPTVSSVKVSTVLPVSHPTSQIGDTQNNENVVSHLKASKVSLATNDVSNVDDIFTPQQTEKIDNLSSSNVDETIKSSSDTLPATGSLLLPTPTSPVAPSTSVDSSVLSSNVQSEASLETLTAQNSHFELSDQVIDATANSQDLKAGNEDPNLNSASFQNSSSTSDNSLKSPVILESDTSKLVTTIRLPDLSWVSQSKSFFEDNNLSFESKDLPITKTSSLSSVTKKKKKRLSLKQGEFVFAKTEKSDLWYQGEIIKEHLLSKREIKAQIRFLTNHKSIQKIYLKNIASMEPCNADDIEIGTRIVAGRPTDTVNSTSISKKDRDCNSNLNVMFAGVVAEIACEVNRNRFLVFFDDGYAQYLAAKKIFPVIGPSNDVWDDVAADCQEFIKEYLQEYPYRPLVCTKIGNMMQTEWNGSWWKSKVVSIDGSLVKILFDIDKRSEWIYRGTTRLEPLYNFFIQPAGTKKRRKKVLKDDSYVDEKITHPQFGFCRHSLKDPKGRIQRQDWAITKEESASLKSSSSTTSDNLFNYSSLSNISSAHELSRPKRSASVLSWSSDCSKNSEVSKSSLYKQQSKKQKVASDTESMYSDKDLFPEKNNTATTISSQEALGAIAALEITDPIIQHSTSMPTLPSSQPVSPMISGKKTLGAFNLFDVNFIRKLRERGDSYETIARYYNNIFPDVPIKRKNIGQFCNQHDIQRKVEPNSIKKTDDVFDLFDVSFVQRLCDRGDSYEAIVQYYEHMYPDVSFDENAIAQFCNKHNIQRNDEDIKVESISDSAFHVNEIFDIEFMRKSKEQGHSYRKITAHYKTLYPELHIKRSHVASYCHKNIDSFSVNFSKRIHCSGDESGDKRIREISSAPNIGSISFPSQNKSVISKCSQGVPHACGKDCILDRRNLLSQHKLGLFNYLAIPFQLGWKRESTKKRKSYHRDTFYRAPCSKRLRNLADITKYLLQTKCSNVCIDMFCFQSNISCRNQVQRLKTPIVFIDDLSEGQETCLINCVNEISDEYPPPVTYISTRMKADDVTINTDPGFLVCCDCTDNCQDKSKCGCAQLTIESSNAIENQTNPNAGYQYRRLKEDITTGIYECNQNCSCSRDTCYNRVVQNGIQLRLQVFLTETRGWGLRCVDDIPKGTFICTYAGQVLNEPTANKEGMDFGDEYLAELDHIEVVEKAKEGYESDVPENREKGFNDSSDDTDSDSDSDQSILCISSDSSDDDTDEDILMIESSSTEKTISDKDQELKRLQTKNEEMKKNEGLKNMSIKNLTDSLNDTSAASTPTSSARKSPVTNYESSSASSTEPPTHESELTSCVVSLRRLGSTEIPKHVESMSETDVTTDEFSNLGTPEKSLLSPPLFLPKQFDDELSKFNFKTLEKERSMFLPLNKGIALNPDIVLPIVKPVARKSTGQKAYAHKSTGGKFFITSRLAAGGTIAQEQNKPSNPSTRMLYGGDNHMYIIDAKSYGNVGRYMNHSCSPNLFVQNVMVDTHDLRFPWVAFFAQQNIPALTELTWDYNYEVGSVPDKELICKCGSEECKGRLL